MLPHLYQGDSFEGIISFDVTGIYDRKAGMDI